MSDRKATSFLNYRGDRTALFDLGRPYGPNTLGEALWPVSVEYNPQTDRTRVGFSLIAPEAVSA